jgi:HMGL-like
MTDSVRIVEVGPRDGLQNEKTAVSIADRVAFIEALIGAGLNPIEVGAFVSPKAIPQMAGSAEVLRAVSGHAGSEFHVLVPNEKAYEGLARGRCQRDCGVCGSFGRVFARQYQLHRRGIDRTVQAGADARCRNGRRRLLARRHGVRTGVDMGKLVAATNTISKLIGRPPVGRVASALNAKRESRRVGKGA